MKKRLICVTLIVICIFNILSGNMVKADNLHSSIMSSMNSGSTAVGRNGSSKSVLPKDSMMGSVANIFVALINPIPSIIRYLLSLIAGEGFLPQQKFSIEKTVFNKTSLFDINYFNENSTSNGANIILKRNVSAWFYSIRNIAIVLNILILLYIGIRMAISTVAEEKAKYKKMLLGWAEGFVIIFVLPYIMILIIKIGEVLLGLISTVHTVGITEETIITKMINSKPKGLRLFIPSIAYWVLVFYQIKFFIIYLRRFLATGFLIIVSPLITVTYAIDKIGDQKPQIFSNWIKEYSVNVLIQPIHAFLYLIFLVSASNIVSEAPMLFIIFLFGLSRGEKVLRNVFKIGKLSSIKNMQETFKASELNDKAKLIA